MALFRHYASPPRILTIQTTLKSKLTAGSSATASVRDTGYNATRASANAFTQNQFCVVEQPGSEKAEIVKISGAVSTADTLTFDVVKHDHPTGTPIAIIDYDQIKFEYSSDGGVTWTSVWGVTTAKNIAIDQEQTLLLDDAAQPNYIYRYNFLNSQTTAQSSYSSTYSVDLNLFGTRYWLRKTIREEGNLNSELSISDQFIDKKIDEALGHYLIRQNNWWFLENEIPYEIYTAPNITSYPLPYDFKSLVCDPEFVDKATGDKHQLTQMTFNEFLAEHRDSSKTPYNIAYKYCFGYRDRLCIDTVPLTGDDSIILYYFRTPKALSHDYAVTDIPDPYILVYLAVSMCDTVNKEIDVNKYRQLAEERIYSSNRGKDFYGKATQKRKLVGYGGTQNPNRYFRGDTAWTL